MGFLNDLTSLQGSGRSLLRPAEPQDGDSDRDAAAGFLDTITHGAGDGRQPLRRRRQQRQRRLVMNPGR